MNRNQTGLLEWLYRLFRILILSPMLFALLVWGQCSCSCKPDLTNPPDLWQKSLAPLANVYALGEYGGQMVAGGSTGQISQFTRSSWNLISITTGNYHGQYHPYNDNVTALVQVGPYLLAGTSGFGFYRYSAGSWTDGDTGVNHPSDTKSFIVDGSTLFAVTSSEIWESSDQGEHWTLNRNMAENYLCGGILPLSGIVLVGAGTYLLQSSNHGVTWTTVSYSNQHTGMGGIAAISTDVDNNGELGYCTYGSAGLGTTYFKFNPANGGGWDDQLDPGPGIYVFTSIAVRNFRSPEIFIGTEQNGIFFNTGNGTNAFDNDRRSRGFNSDNVTCMHNKASEGRVYLGTTAGVYYEK